MIPFAHIRRAPLEPYSVCGDHFGPNEFVFDDAKHAMRHYVHSSFLRVCKKCQRAWSEANG